MPDRKDFGVLYGQKTTEDSLLIYSSYEDAKASPLTGDFIVLAPKDDGGTKFLARVEAEIYDEDPIFRSQDKTLVAVHYARIAERELSERDKQKMFSYTYKVRILGTFTDTGQAIEFTTAVRRLPTVSYIARHLNKREIEHILNRGNEGGVEIGDLCVGDTVYNEKGKIQFDTKKLRSRRTMIFAQSGFGKTNFVKVLVERMMRDTSYGKLIFDLNGEYVLRGQKTYGLGDINEDHVRDNLVVYTDRNVAHKNYFTYKGEVLINMHKHLSVGDILSFGSGFSEVMKSFLLYLDDGQVQNFVANIDDYTRNPEKLHRNFSDFFGDAQKKTGKEEASSRRTVAAIRKRIAHLIEEGKGIHKEDSKLVENVFDLLKKGKTVVIDLSLKDNFDASIISTILVRKLFDINKANYTSSDLGTDGLFDSAEGKKVIETVIFVEEAQNVLSEEFVRSNANPFVRVAKEGRKFGLGLVAITQRPSAISEEIRTQAENFFSFYMGNTDDVRALIKSNVNYDGVISKFIQRETIPGNLYMVSAGQSFVLPVRVSEFEKLVAGKVYATSKFPPDK